MCFVEPIAVCLFTICYSNVYVHLLFTKIILLDTIFFAKIFVKLFLQHNSYPEVLYFLKKLTLTWPLIVENHVQYSKRFNLKYEA